MSDKNDKKVAKKKRIRAKRITTVNLKSCSNSSSDLMRRIIAKHDGWSSVTHTEASIMWSNTLNLPTVCRGMRDHWIPGQRTNMRIGFRQCLDKSTMFSYLNQSRRIVADPSEYDFFPRSYDNQNSADMAELKQTMDDAPRDTKSRATYIVKPSVGSEGDGIALCQSWESIINCADPNKQYVIQRYIANPLTLKGFKFDLRIYVLVTSFNPDISFYVFRDGLARFCTTRYAAPTPSNLHQAHRHLTNYALNKLSENFIRANEYQVEDGDDSKKSLSTTKTKEPNASKMSIEATFAQLLEDFTLTQEDIDVFWTKVEAMVSATLKALWAPCSEAYHVAFDRADEKGSTSPSKAFHIIGIDVLIDEDLKPWLLEMNANPSFVTDSDLDLYIKQSIMEQSLRLMNYTLDVVKDFEPAAARTAIDKYGNSVYVPATLSKPLEMKHSYVNVPGNSILFHSRDDLLWKIYHHMTKARRNSGISSGQFNRFLRNFDLLSSSFTSADADIFYQRTLKVIIHSYHLQYDEASSLRARTMNFTGFCTALIALAKKRFKAASEGEQLELLLDHLAQQQRNKGE